MRTLRAAFDDRHCRAVSRREAQATFNPPPSGPSCTTSNGITTLKVPVLDTTTGFGEPEQYFPTPLPATKTYQRPAASVTTIQSSSAMANDLSKAFAIAPYFFQSSSVL